MTQSNANTPEQRLREYFERVTERGRVEGGYGENYRMYSQGERGGIITTLAVLGIKIEGVNAY